MTNSRDISTGRHVVFELYAHLVFVTKYRRGVITDRVRRALHARMEMVCEKFDCELLEFDGKDEYVHLLVKYPAKVALSRLVNSLKGASSRVIRKMDYPEVTNALWGDAFWSPSYCAVSCGGAPLKVVKQYIQNQRVRGDSV